MIILQLCQSDFKMIDAPASFCWPKGTGISMLTLSAQIWLMSPAGNRMFILCYCAVSKLGTSNIHKCTVRAKNMDFYGLFVCRKHCPSTPTPPSLLRIFFLQLNPTHWKIMVHTSTSGESVGSAFAGRCQVLGEWPSKAPNQYFG